MSDHSDLQVVDPQVSRGKFQRELDQYRSLEAVHTRKGWWLVKAEFPEILVIFGTPHLAPPVIAFGALLDFTNYDVWPISVKLVNPFTRVPYKASELPTNLPRRHAVQPSQNSPAQASDAPVAQVQEVTVAPMMMLDSPTHEPFLCLPGTRAYHHHPSHSGDSWLLRRGRGEGNLFSVLNTLYTYGVSPMGFSFQMQFKLGIQAERIPA